MATEVTALSTIITLIIKDLILLTNAYVHCSYDITAVGEGAFINAPAANGKECRGRYIHFPIE